MKPVCAVAAILVACGLPTDSATSERVPEEPTAGTAYVDGRWFDGTGFVARDMYGVAGRLTATRPAEVDSTIDLGGGFVVPPFGEAHNHNVEGSRAAQTSRAYLLSGIFYVKNPNSLPGVGLRLESVVNTPTAIDAIFAGGGLTASDGHPWGLVRRNIERGIWTEADAEGAFVHSIDNVAALDAKWSQIVSQGPDFIKTYLLYSEEFATRSGDPAYTSWSGLDPALLGEIVRRAHAAGLRVSTHVESAGDFRNAVAAGSDEINHLPGFRLDSDRSDGWSAATYEITSDDAHTAARRGTVVVTTIGPTLEYLAGPESDELPSDLRVAWREVILSNLRTLKSAGVAIALGTDRYQSTDHTEAAALHGTGVFSNLELLTMWTEVTARAIFPDRRVGRLDEGFEASFLVLAGNPLEDFAQTGRIVLRVKQGRLLDE